MPCFLHYLYLNNVFSEQKEEIDFNSKNFCQEKYPLELKYVEDYGSKNLRIVGKNSYLNDFGSYYEPTWLYRKSNLFGWDDKYRIDINSAAIWIDMDKYDGEDETNMLFTLNSMKNSYFKSPLSENIFYYIFG